MLPIRLRPSLPPRLLEATEQTGLKLTEGLPVDTWNGMTLELHTVGAKGGSREVHLLPPGLHPATPDVAKARFAWNEERLALWHRLERAAPTLREEYGISHVAFGGSYFGTDWPRPSDMDGAAFYDADILDSVPRPPYTCALDRWNQQQGDQGIHLYRWDESLYPPAGPTPMRMFSRAPPHPRPRSFELRGPKGPETGLVLLDLGQF